MTPLTTNDIETAFGVSHGTAVKLRKLVSAAEFGRLRSVRSALKKVAKRGIKSDICADQLTSWMAENDRKGGRARATPRRRASRRQPKTATVAENGTPEHTSADSGEAANAQTPIHPPEDESRMFERAAATCRRVTVVVGEMLEHAVQHRDIPKLLTLTDRFQKLQAELRQTEGKLLEVQRERAEMWPRDDVIAACADQWAVMRSFGDALIGELVTVGNLPCWIDEVGGSFPDTRAARETLQGRIRGLVEPRFNALADSLADCAVPLPDLLPAIAAECRKRMADELRGLATRLEGDQ